MRTSRRVVRGQYRQGRGALLGRRLWAMGLVLVAACVSPEMRENSGQGSVKVERGAPAWVGTPLSWGKLEGLGRWLEREADSYDPYWRVQGELVLGEGRLTYSRRESAESGSSSTSWAARLQSARSSFQRVVTDPRANELQTERARQGLEEIDGLRSGLARTASPSISAKGVLSRASWRARAPVTARLDNNVGRYDRITIHHTADVPGVRFDGSLSDSVSAVQKVQRNHMDTRSYGDIGYHFLIDSRGRIFQGRDLRYQGAHAGGVNNVHNIGVCLIGNFEHSRPSSTAMATLQGLLVDLRKQHGIPRTRIVGHGELKSTACPGTNLARWTKDYRRTGPALSLLQSSSTPFKTATSASFGSRSVGVLSHSPALSAPVRGSRSVVR